MTLTDKLCTIRPETCIENVNKSNLFTNKANAMLTYFGSQLTSSVQDMIPLSCFSLSMPFLTTIVRNKSQCLIHVHKAVRQCAPCSYHAIITPLSVQNFDGGQSRCNPVASVTIFRVCLMYSLLATPPETTYSGAQVEEQNFWLAQKVWSGILTKCQFTTGIYWLKFLNIVK